jgi:hypothetical protein
MNLVYIILIIILIFIFLYIKKKLKKYHRIFKTNGLDGIYYYFINKNFNKTGISNFIDKKKHILGKKLAKYSKQKIIFGPYSGTKFINSYGWSNIDYSPKYLGTYEKQIQEKIIFLKKKYKLNLFVDCGAAEGYHIISLLRKKIFKKAIAFEIDKISRNILRKNATANNVSKKISIYSDANFNSLKINLKKEDLNKILFLFDIEGNEFNLFDVEFCRYFSKSFFIIEDHNFNILKKDKINLFYKNIYKFFKVEIIRDESKNPFDYTILDNFTEDEKYLMMSEGRPKTMNWILLYPKKIL